MSKVAEMKEKIKEKAKSVKETAKIVKEETVQFLGENPGLFIPIISGLGMVASVIIGATAKNGETRLEACRVEDDITGMDFLTKEPMTNAEIIELGDRMMDGQTKGAALNEMGLLRNEKKRRV